MSSTLHIRYWQFFAWIPRLLSYLVISSAFMACSASPDRVLETNSLNPQDLLIVDCLLPPQVRQLGTSMTYLGPRRAIRTAGAHCAQRGGEYVAYDRADFKSALAVWLPLAELGDPEAQTYVGEIHEKGMGTRASYELAAKWYQLAANQNYSRAQTNLGYLYESGLGVERDLARALNLYRRAAGFTSAELEFVSSVEIATREATTRQAAQLGEEVEFLQNQISAEKAQLDITRDQLDKALSEKKALQSSLKANQSSDNEQQVSLRQYELDAREANVSALQSEVAKLRQSLASRQANLEPLDAIEQIAQTRPRGPTINILDPPVLITRGAPALAIGDSSKASVIGKIDPADALFAFRINGEDHPVSPTGMFQYASQTDRTGQTGKPGKIEILAIDNNGASTRLALSLGKRPLQDFTPELTAEGREKSQIGALASTDNKSHELSQVNLENSAAKTKKSNATLSLKEVEFGEYHALIIGNDTYDALNSLKTAGNDAIAVERVLREKYDFTTVLLLNANQKTILKALEQMRATLDEQDNLVIYYAGHGELDSYTGHGYWLPTDSSATDKKKWIANSAITSMIDSMAAKHILIIADSCYSGALTRSSIARALPQASNELRLRWLKAVSQSRVRTVLSSGDNRPVLDGSASSEHSVFAGFFLDALQQNTDVMETYELFFNIQQKVATAAASLDVYQTPQYAPIKHSGHQAGDFLFVPNTQR